MQSIQNFDVFPYLKAFVADLFLLQLFIIESIIPLFFTGGILPAVPLPGVVPLVGLVLLLRGVWRGEQEADEGVLLLRRQPRIVRLRRTGEGGGVRHLGQPGVPQAAGVDRVVGVVRLQRHLRGRAEEEEKGVQGGGRGVGEEYQ